MKCFFEAVTEILPESYECLKSMIRVMKFIRIFIELLMKVYPAIVIINIIR